MEYFDIGINNGIRTMDIYIIRTPVVIIAQLSTVFFFDKFISRHKGQRTLLNILALVLAVCVVFIAFAIIYQGVPREGGFIRFLGHYFFGQEPGRFPGNGDW